MKVYFSASLHVGVDKSIYQEIVKTIEKMGHKLVSNHVVNNSSKDQDEKISRNKIGIHNIISKNIVKADIAVFEVSFPSTLNIGHEVTIALDKGKPVIALYQPGKEPGIMQGIHSDRFLLLEYEKEDLNDVLTYGLEDAAEKIDIRYNFFISPKMTRFLDDVAKKKRVPRAVFLRKLIETDMEKSDYE